MFKKIIILSSLLIFSSVQAAVTGETITALEINNMGLHIGDIKTSVLSQSQFQTIHGSCWVLMDGRDISGKDLAVLTGRNTVPDSRGTFLRGKDNGAGRNADGDLTLGSYQLDSLQNIYGELPGGGIYQGNPSSGAFTAAQSRTVTLPSSGRAHYESTVNFDASRVARTSTETRPKNITVNYFIKVHKTCN